jgi:Uma2 family endonuclease
MPKTAIKIGPQDHGQRMSLADFDHAEVQEGYLYELSRGVLTVSDVPGPKHAAVVENVREQLVSYKVTHPGRIRRILAGNECKLLVNDFESERHPDLAVYKTKPPRGKDLWVKWVPAILMEAVSPSSKHRDYEEKPDEYRRFGVQEYWIINAEEEEMLVLRNRGDHWAERIVRPGTRYRTRLLPGFALDVAQVFAEAEGNGD